MARIHISYSEAHFHPGRERDDNFWSLYGQASYYLWKCHTEHYQDVSYGDAIPKEQIDLLWCQRGHAFRPNVKREVFLAQQAHYMFVQKQLKMALRTASPKFIKTESLRGRKRMGKLWNNFKRVALSDATFALSNPTIFNSYREHASSYFHKCLSVNWGIDRERFRSFRPRTESNVFVYPVNSFCLQKGAHIMASAWKTFSSRHPEARLILLGRPSDYQIQEELAHLANVEHLGPFVAGSEDYVKQLNRAKWVVMPSIFEGQAGTLLEAMSCGCIPIVSRASGIDGERYGGFVIEPDNDDYLVNLLELAIKDTRSDRQQDCHAMLDQEHNWASYQRSALEVTAQLLAKPPAKKPAIAGVMANFCGQMLRHRLQGSFTGFSSVYSIIRY